MKIKIHFSIFLATLLISSCSSEEKEKGNEKIKNYFNFNESTTEITTAAVFLDPIAGETSAKEGLYFHEVVLLSKKLKINGNTLSGTGDEITMTITSSSPQIQAGTYHFKTSNEYSLNEIEFGKININTNIDIPGSGTSYNLSSGEIIISKSNNTYTIEFDGLTNTQNLKVVYSGPLIIVEEEDIETPEDFFTFNKSTTEITEAAVFLDPIAGESSTGQGLYFHEIVLLSKNLVFNNNEVSGTGDGITITISSHSSQLVAGTYPFKTSQEDLLNEIEFGRIYINLNTAVPGSGTPYNLGSGKLTISKSTSIYTIKFEGTSDIENLRFEYKGTMLAITDSHDHD